MSHRNCPSNTRVLNELKEFAYNPKYEEWDLRILLNVCYAALGHSGYESRVLSIPMLRKFINYRKSRIKELGFITSIIGIAFSVNDESFENCPSILKLERTFTALKNYSIELQTEQNIHDKIFKDKYVHNLLGVPFDQDHLFNT